MKERTKAQTVHHLLSLVKNSKLLGGDKKEARISRATTNQDHSSSSSSNGMG